MYLFYGFKHSNEANFNQGHHYVETPPGRVKFHSSPQLGTKVKRIQPDNLVDQTSPSWSSDEEKNFDFPQK